MLCAISCINKMLVTIVKDTIINAAVNEPDTKKFGFDKLSYFD